MFSGLTDLGVLLCKCCTLPYAGKKQWIHISYLLYIDYALYTALAEGHKFISKSIFVFYE